MRRISIYEVKPELVTLLARKLTHLYMDLATLINGEKLNACLLLKINLTRNRIKEIIMAFYDEEPGDELSTKQRDTYRKEIHRMHAISIYLVGLPFTSHPHRLHDLFNNAVTAKKRIETLMSYLGQNVKELKEKCEQQNLNTEWTLQ
jgi:hypothetical protein